MIRVGASDPTSIINSGRQEVNCTPPSDIRNHRQESDDEEQLSQLSPISNRNKPVEDHVLYHGSTIEVNEQSLINLMDHTRQDSSKHGVI